MCNTSIGTLCANEECRIGTRTVRRIEALVRTLDRWTARVEHSRREKWIELSQLGASPASGIYSVTERGAGYAIATLADTGEQRRIDAPTPLI